MDASWKEVKAVSSDMPDVFNSQFLRNFQGQDGHQFGGQTKEGRYVFSLGVDFFNPFTNKQVVKKVSFGIISVVCLNLPASM
jgi:hypothetical protein